MGRDQRRIGDDRALYPCGGLAARFHDAIVANADAAERMGVNR